MRDLVSEIAPERRPANLLPFDYHHEKTALTRMAYWLMESGWEEVKLSVPPKHAFFSDPLGGLDPTVMDDAFVQRFNGDDWQFRYNFYHDRSGNFDLVARKGDETLILEGKGRSASNRRGAVAQMIGSLVLVRRPNDGSVRHGILIPDGPAWDSTLRNTGGLDWIELYRIGAAPPGEIEVDTWTRYLAEEPAPA